MDVAPEVAETAPAAVVTRFNNLELVHGWQRQRMYPPFETGYAQSLYRMWTPRLYTILILLMTNVHAMACQSLPCWRESSCICTRIICLNMNAHPQLEIRTIRIVNVVVITNHQSPPRSSMPSCAPSLLIRHHPYRTTFSQYTTCSRKEGYSSTSDR